MSSYVFDGTAYEVLKYKLDNSRLVAVKSNDWIEVNSMISQLGDIKGDLPDIECIFIEERPYTKELQLSQKRELIPLTLLQSIER